MATQNKYAQRLKDVRWFIAGFIQGQEAEGINCQFGSSHLRALDAGIDSLQCTPTANVIPIPRSRQERLQERDR